MASNYWIKLYHEMLDDPKIGRLTDSQFRLMINLFLLAGDCEQDGYLPCVDDISWRLRNPPTLQDDLDALMKFNIITEEDGALVINKFAERQSAMSAEERSQRRRERDRKLEYYGTKSARNPHDSCADVDVDIDKEVDVDKDVESGDHNPLITTFTQHTKLNPGAEAPKIADELQKAGVIQKDIVNAINFLTNNQNMKCTSFKSVRNSAIIEMQRRTGSKKKIDIEDPRRYLKGEYGEFGSH